MRRAGLISGHPRSLSHRHATRYRLARPHRSSSARLSRDYRGCTHASSSAFLYIASNLPRSTRSPQSMWDLHSSSSRRLHISVRSAALWSATSATTEECGKPQFLIGSARGRGRSETSHPTRMAMFCIRSRKPTWRDVAIEASFQWVLRSARVNLGGGLICGDRGRLI